MGLVSGEAADDEGVAVVAQDRLLIDLKFARRNAKRSGVDGEASDMDAGCAESSNHLLLERERSTWSTERNGSEHRPEADGIATPLLARRLYPES